MHDIHLKMKSLLSYLLLLYLSPLFEDSAYSFEEFLLTCSSILLTCSSTHPCSRKGKERTMRLAHKRRNRVKDNDFVRAFAC